MQIELKRAEYLPGGTYGRMIAPSGDHICFTVELPWLDNARGKSCIPAGTYPLRWVDSPKFGRRLQVCDVPGRTHILIHAGNFQRNTDGCILPNTAVMVQGAAVAGRDSRVALGLLESMIPDDGSDHVLKVPPGVG